MKEDPPLRAALYCRISQTDEDFDKIASQQHRLEAEASRQGYVVVHVFTDDGISAYSDASRPGFADLLVAIEDRRVDVVLATESSRFARNGEVASAFLGLCARAGVRTHTLSEGMKDVSDPTAKAMSAIGFIFAEMESAMKASRVRARNAENFRLGVPRGGRRAFGYQQDGRTRHEIEAPLIADAYERILAKRATQQSIAREWNARDLRTTADRPWSSHAVRDVLCRPMNAGVLRRATNWHRGIKKRDIVYAFEESSAIEPIVSREIFEQFMQLVGDRPQRVGRPATSLLSGIMLCPCGHTMVGSQHASGQPIYRCDSRRHPGRKGQPEGHAIIARHLGDDQALEGLYFALLDMPPLESGAAGVAPIQARMAALRQETAELSSRLAFVGLDPRPIEARLRELDDLIRAVELELQRALADDATSPLRAALALVDTDEAELEDGSTITYVDSMTRAAFFAREFRNLPIDLQRAVLRGPLEIRLSPKVKAPKPGEPDLRRYVQHRRFSFATGQYKVSRRLAVETRVHVTSVGGAARSDTAIEDATEETGVDAEAVAAEARWEAEKLRFYHDAFPNDPDEAVATYRQHYKVMPALMRVMRERELTMPRGWEAPRAPMDLEGEALQAWAEATLSERQEGTPSRREDQQCSSQPPRHPTKSTAALPTSSPTSVSTVVDALVGAFQSKRGHRREIKWPPFEMVFMGRYFGDLSGALSSLSHRALGDLWKAGDELPTVEVLEQALLEITLTRAEIESDYEAGTNGRGKAAGLREREVENLARGVADFVNYTHDGDLRRRMSEGGRAGGSKRKWEPWMLDDVVGRPVKEQSRETGIPERSVVSLRAERLRAGDPI